jgi:hypothetical protein
MQYAPSVQGVCCTAEVGGQGLTIRKCHLHRVAHACCLCASGCERDGRSGGGQQPGPVHQVSQQADGCVLSLNAEAEHQ